MGRRRALWLVLPLLGLVLACALAATAGAYTYVVRPNTTISGGTWAIVPSGTIDSVLDDNVLAPTLPVTGSDYVTESGNGPIAFEVGLGDVALRGGENVTSVKSWAYAATGDQRTIDSELRHGTTVLASGTWPSNVPASWQSVTYTGALTQAELNDLRQRRTLTGNGSSTATFVYAAYAEVATDMASTPTITGGPGVTGQGTNPSWSFTASPAASFQCRLETGGGAVVSDWAVCTSAKSYALATDGTYVFKVRVHDDIGTAGPEASSSYTLDRAAPNAPTIVSAPADPGNDPTVDLAFTAEGGAVTSCRLERGATVVSDWALCTSPRSYDLTAEADGAYTFRVTATDAAGNTSAEGVDTFTLDTTDPAAPTITSAPPASGNSLAPSWSFTPEAGATTECRLERGATVVSDWASCTSPKTWDLTSQPDGTYTFLVRATDGAGNTGVDATGSYVLDTTDPAAPTITAAPSGESQNQAPSYSFTSDAGTTNECRIERGATVVDDWGPCVSPRSYDLSLQADGTYTFRVRSIDAATNTGPEDTSSYTLDRTDPVAPTITSGPAAQSADDTPTYGFTAEAGSTTECRIEQAGTPVQDWASCTTAHTADISGQADGAYTFLVRATDAAGNTGPGASYTYTLDRTGPVAPTITSAPPASGNSFAPAWSFTHEAGAAATCRLERGATVVSDWASCTSPKTWDLTAQPEGTYSFRVRATDVAGNPGAVATGTYTLDTTDPAAPTITAAPSGESQNQAPSYSFTSDAGTTNECRIERGATIVSDWGSCVSPRSYDLSLQADGAYTFRVRSTDAATNTGPEATTSYTLDRTAPAAPTITSTPAAESSDDTPTYSFTAEPGATFDCRMRRGTTNVYNFAPCTSAHTYDLTAQIDGTYTFFVRATDAAGNPSGNSTHVYTLDRSAPAPPTITGGPTGDTQNASPSYTFTAGAGETTECRMERGATAIEDWTACASPKAYNLAGEVDGTYTFRVRARDGATNVSGDSTLSYALDRTAPSAPTITSAPPATHKSTSPSWSFTTDAGTSASCRLERGATVVSDWAGCTSPKAWNLAAEPEGTYTFKVRATDAANNTGTVTSGTYVLDMTAPVAPTITGGPTGDSQDDTPTYTFTGEAGGTFECRVMRGATLVNDWAACVTGHTPDLTAQPDGTYTFEVRNIDVATNTGPAASRSYTLDQTAPAAPTITGGPPTNTNSSNPSFTFTHAAGATATCRLTRGATVVSDWTACASPHAYNLTAQADGFYTFRVRATDAAGNTGTEATRSFTLDRIQPDAPTITGEPAAITNDSTPTWTFTASFDVAWYRCRIERGATVVSDYAFCASPHTYDLTSQPDGTYTFKVRGSDDSANESTEVNDTFTLDRTPPAAPTITGGPTGTTQNAAPAYTFTTEAGSTTQCRMERGATVVEDWGACVTGRSYDLSLQPDGAYTFRVRATDTATNTGTDATRTYTLDRTAPAAPTVTGGPAADANDDSPVYSFTGEAGASYTCRLERGGTAVSDWAACSTPVGFDLSAEVDGSYTFRVRATDAAGNTSTDGTRTYALDRVAPSAPTLTADPGAATNDDTPSWSFSSDPGTTTACRLERGATVLSNWGACASPRTYDLSAEPEAAYTFRVRATDAAGNTGDETAHTTTLDRTAPAAPTITSGPAGDSADDSPTFGFTGEAGAAASCRVERGATVVDDWAPCVSPRTYDLSLQADGTYTFRLEVTDAAGNTSPEATLSYNLDRADPAAPVIVSAPAAESSDDTPTYDFTSEPGSTTECRVEQGGTAVLDWAPCTTAHTADLSGEADGAYTFLVRATDAAGNTGADASHTYTLDRGAPAPPTIGSGPTGDSQDESPTYTFTVDAGTVAECRLERSGTAVSDWSACTSPQSYDLTSEPDGTYTFLVRTTDGALNVSGESTLSYALDRTEPAAPVITSAPAATDNDPSPAWAFTQDAGASAECRLERGATLVGDWAPCASPKSWALAGEIDGTYTFRVRSTDSAGNTGAEATGAYVLDRDAPAAPAITGGPTGDSSNGAPSYTFTAEAGAATECRLERGATLVSDWSACASPRAYDLSAQADGGYTFRVRATDAAGNTGADATRSYTLDRSAPAAPTITGGPPANTNSATPSFTFTYESGAAASCRMTRGATLVADWAPCSSPHLHDLSGEVDGSYTFHVRATDAAANTGAIATRSFTLDRIQPDAPTITGEPAAITNDPTPTWTFTASFDVVKYRCRLERGATVISDYAVCTSPQTYNLGGEPDGTYTFKVRGSDDSANESTEVNDTFTLDRVAPVAPVFTGGPTGDSADDTPTYSFTSEPGSTTQCRVERGATLVSDWAACSSPETFDLSGEVDGAYTVRVRATDTAGNTGPSASRDYTLDRDPPAAPSITTGPTGDTQDDTPTYSWTAEAGSTSECRVERGATVVSDWAACADPRSYNLAAEADGVYRFLVRASDAAGNTGPEATRDYTLDRTDPLAPAVTSAPAADSPDDTPSFTFTAEAGSATECRLERGATLVSDWTSCASPATFDVSGEADGLYTFSVRATDAAGNTGTAGTASYTLDRDAPAAPSITDGPTGDSQDAAPAYSFTAEAGAATACRLERGATVVDDWGPCLSPRSYDLSLQPDAAYTFRVRATDAAGNTGTEATRDYTLDRTPPAAPTFTGGPAGEQADDTPTYDWTGEIGSSSECRVERGGTLVSDWTTCSTPHTQDLTGEVDGAYTFLVRSTDAAGNTGADASRSYTLDRTPPVAPTITAGPTGDSSDATPEYAWTAEAGATTECRVERGGTAVADWAPCASPRTYDVSGEADGGLRFLVRATDPAGNTGAEATRDFTLDRAAPDAPAITTQPAADSADDTPTWGWSATPDAVSFRCRIQRGTAIVSDWAACTDPSTFDLSAEPDGAYTIRVRASDAAGNEGLAGVDSYTLDRTAPAAPTITAGPTGDSQDATPTYEWTGEAGSTSECRIESGATAVVDWEPCTSPRSFDLTAEPDAAYTFSVRSTDAAGNTGAPASRGYTLDRQGPGAPTVTVRPDDDTSDETPTWGWSPDPESTSFQCRLERDGIVVRDWAPCTDPHTYDLSTEPDGEYTFTVRPADAAGNEANEVTDTFTLDRSEPPAATITGGPTGESADDTPTYTWTGEAGATSECRVDRGATTVVAWQSCSSPETIDLSSETDGAYTFRVRLSDAAGNTGAEATRDYTLDRVAPGAPAVTAQQAAEDNDATPTWGWSADADAVAFECRLERGATIVGDWAACTDPRMFDLGAAPDGDYTFRLRASDAAGNTSAAASEDYTLDRVAPLAPSILVGPTGASQDDTPAYQWAVEPGATSECRIERGATVVDDWAPCTTPETFDLTAEPDGGYRFLVRATDAAGNTGAESTRDYTLDRTAPAAPAITSGPAADSPDDTPSYGFSAETGAATECRLDRGATTVSGWTSCATPRLYDLSGEVDGAYTFSVRAIDAAGNTGTRATRSYRLDRDAPAAPTITSGPAADSQDATPSYGFTAEAGAARACRIERGATVVSDWAACVSPRSYDLSLLPDGAYTFRVRATDAAGNTGPESTRGYTLDRVAPAAPAFTAGPSGESADDTPLYSWTGEIGSASSCRVERGGAVVSAWAPCSTPHTQDLSNENDGTYTFRVRSTDAAGNTGADAARTYTLDRGIPDAPTITAGPTGDSQDETPAFGWTAEAGVATQCRLERGATVVSDWQSCASPRFFDLNSEPDGGYRFRVRATDGAGNTGPDAQRSYTLDRVAPGTPSLTAQPSADSSDATPTWGWSADADAVAAECRLERGSTILGDWSTCADPRTFDLAAEPDGAYTFRVRVNDAAGNRSADRTDTFRLDRDAPAAPAITAGPTGDSRDDTPSYAWTAESGAASECRIERGATVVSDWAACAEPRTFDLSAEPDGGYTFSVRATDAAGNTGPEATRGYMLDRNAPPAPAITAGPAASSSDDTPSFSFTAEAAAATECRIERGATAIGAWQPCTSPRLYDLGAEADGAYTFSVRATDTAGNTGAVATRAYVLDRSAPAAPTITSGPTGDARNDAPSYSFTAEAGAATSCRLERGATVVEDWGPCVRPRSYDLALQPDGAYTFRVRATDAAGNTGTDATRAYTLDRAAPAAPTITAGPTGDSPDDTPTYEWSGELGAASACRIERGATIVSDWAACSTPHTHDLSGQADGTYTFRVRSTDAAGNTGPGATRSYTLDRDVPPAPTITAGPTGDSSDDSPTYRWTTEAAWSTQCRLERGPTIVSDWAACAAPHSFDLRGEPDGGYRFLVRATDGAGNTGAAAERAYTLDRVAPDAPAITTRPADDSSDETPTWSWSAAPDAVAFRCRTERGTTVVTDWATCAEPLTADFAGEPDGTYTFRVRAGDAAGNWGAIAADTFRLDRVAPDAPVITSGPSATSPDRTPTFAWTAEAAATTECRIERGSTTVADWTPCGSPRTFDLSAEPDGAYRFRVRATDAAGNVGAGASRTWTLDRGTPNAPVITAGPAGDTRDDSPIFGFTSEPRTSTECRLDRGATVVSGWQSCASPRLYDLSGEPDGVYRFRVRAIDGASNVGPAAERSFRLDRTAPDAPSITSGPAADSRDANPSYGFTAETGATTTCRVERGGTVVSDWAPCVSPRSYDLSLQPDGTYTFGVRAIDAAGNAGPAATRDYTLDRTAPAPPTITAGPAAESADDTPTYEWTGEIGSSSSCRVERAGTVVSDWAPCSTPHTHDLSSENDDAYTFRVRSTDAAGNTGASAARTYDLDRGVPDAPVITAGPVGESRDATPRYDWTHDGASAECRLERAGTVVDEWGACTSPRFFDLDDEPDALYRFLVRATDGAGNTGPAAQRSYTLDRLAPDAPAITTRPADDSSDDRPAWGWSAASDAIAFRCRIERGGTIVSDWTACGEPRTFDLSAEPDGAYTFRVRAVDAAGNSGPSSADTYELDREPPAAPAITAGPTGERADDTPTYEWTGEAGTASSCRVERAGSVLRDWAPCSTPYEYDLSDESDGTFAFRVRSTDAAGNTGPVASRSFTLDRDAPAAPTITTAPAAASADATATYAFTAESGAALECRLDRDGDAVRPWAPCASPRAYDLGGEPDGAYTFGVRATDAAQNTGPVAEHTHRLDRSVPFSPRIDSRPGDEGNDRTPEWAFSTIELERTFECRLTRGTTVLADWGACAGPREYDLALQPDGPYTFEVRAINPAGTRGLPTADTYRLDTTPPPAPVISGGPAAHSSDDTPSWDMTAEPDATLECRIERGGDVVSGWAACSTPHGYDLGSEPDGSYTFSARATDAAGNTGPAASSSYELDRSLPAVPVFGDGPPDAGNDPTPTWEFTGTPGSTFECRVLRGEDVVAEWETCASPFTPDLTEEPDGEYTVEVRTVNPAGTRGPSATDDYELDRSAPAAPAITSGPDDISSDDTPTWSFTGEPAGSFECRVDRGDTAVSAWAPCADPADVNLNAEPDGAYTFRVRQTDPAGNTSPAAADDYELDRSLPGPPTIDERPASPGADRTPAWRVSGTAGLTLECRLTRGGDVVEDWAPCASPREYELEDDGEYTFHVRQFNRAGSRGPEVADEYLLDASGPAAPVITGGPGAVGNGSNPAWSFTAEEGAGVECRLERGGIVVRDWERCTSPRSYGIAGEPDGDYRFSVRAIDDARNTSPPAVDDHRVDRVPPAPPAIGDNPGPLGRDSSPAWSFTAEDGATFECTLERAGGTLDPWAVCISPRGYDLAGQQDGPYAFAVRARDAAGNTSFAATSPYALDTTPGAVTIESGPGPRGRDRNPAWRFSGEEGASFECRLSLTDVPVAEWGPCVSPHGFDLSGRPDGTFTFALRATDRAGNVGTAGMAAYELDTTPPAAPSIDASPDTPGTDPTPSWRFSGEEGATFACRVDRVPSGTVLDWTLCVSPFTADLAAEADGAYRFSVRATDALGNAGSAATGAYELRSAVEEPRGGGGGDEKGDTGDVPQKPTEAPADASGEDDEPETDAAPAPPAAGDRKPRREREDPPVTRRPEPRTPDSSGSDGAMSGDDGGDGDDDGGNFATDAVKDAVNAIAENPDKSVFPLALLLLVLAFLAIQNRIDRSDPKLALAPTFADPDLEFRPSPGDNE